jgi:hypothetical protein
MNRFEKRVSRIGSGPLPSFLSLVFIELIVLVKVQQRVEDALTVECLSRRRETSWIRRPARPLPSDHNLARLRWLACALRLDASTPSGASCFHHKHLSRHLTSSGIGQTLLRRRARAPTVDGIRDRAPEC